MAVGAGKYRHRVTLERYVATSNGLGAFNYAWSPVGDRWAMVTPTGGREALANGSLSAQQDYRVMMRFDASITNADRVIWNGKALKIVNVEDVDGLRESIVAYCSYVVDEAQA